MYFSQNSGYLKTYRKHCIIRNKCAQLVTAIDTFSVVIVTISYITLQTVFKNLHFVLSNLHTECECCTGNTTECLSLLHF